jgi:hypothetical protein
VRMNSEQLKQTRLGASSVKRLGRQRKDEHDTTGSKY